ncbi:hypothetical protein DIS24_g11566 [Lasiodiplodia hormozganensis]|uniref:Methylmalonyl-CoA epimerase n=1 Tax=Lasiodiplodia hormozganensis TaxID=869390 RepID=A0AA40BYU2_9PEZI|nr:Methylmalonyl-epimerase [Lasiodiplodia theobromae]KAF4537153.1 Methylmalonyl-epimerase [Lasiodiplodia theobromae]KAK0618742.1 hypothetical protein DIS24_g11566 [Lasiodiplodia hormozganensis]
MATTATTTPSFLGNPMEICLVTRDYKRTISGLHALGIGPWRCYSFTPSNTTNQTYRGQASDFTLRVCFAELSPTMVYEVIQPVSGPNIFQEFLDQHGEGVHHIAYDMNGIPFEERVKEFEKRGFVMSQGGSWMGRNHFAFFETEEKTGTCFETYEFPADWDYPEPESWFPHPPQ